MNHRDRSGLGRQLDFNDFPTFSGTLDAVRDAILVQDDTDKGIYRATFATVGRSWTGTTFPAGPSDGDLFFRTDHGEWYTYDSTLGFWIGEERTFEFGKGGTGYNNQYIEFGGDAINSSARGVYVPYDIYITGLTASWVTALTSGDFRVRRGGTNTYTADWGVWGDTTTTIDKTDASGSTSSDWTSFAANGKLTFYLDTLSTGINHVHALVFWRRKES